MGSKFFIVRDGSYKYGKGEYYSVFFNVGLELEVLCEFIVFNIDW